MHNFFQDKFDMLSGLFERIGWNWTLVIIGCAFWLANTAIFYPGYLSPDSLNQLSQAQGILPVTDWHPPVMQLFWHVLILLTNHTSSILILQTLWLWAGLILLALAVYSMTQSRKLSVIPYGIALLPPILNISGVIWKDVHMAFALLLASSLLITLSIRTTGKKMKIAMIAVSLALVIYATLVRYNAFLSVLPIIYLIALQLPWATSKKRIFLTMIGIVGVIGLSGALVNSVTKPQATHPASAIMLDDVINAVPTEAIHAAQIPDKLKQVLLSSQAKCKEQETVRNAFWACLRIGEEQKIISVSYADDLAGFWAKSLFAHPMSYLGYRAQTFIMFLVVPEGTEYVWHEGITPNDQGQAVKFERIQHIMKHYVVDWSHRYFPFLFQGWFWLVAAVITFKYSYGSKRFGEYSRALSLSAILYILMYIPIVVAMDYRYIY